MWHHKAERQKGIVFDTRSSTERRPFDTRALERLPRPNRNDPPYRTWWVVEPKDDE